MVDEAVDVLTHQQEDTAGNGEAAAKEGPAVAEREETEAVSEEALMALLRYELVASDGAIYKMKSAGRDLVCNFQIEEIRSGEARYLNGRKKPLHTVRVSRPNGSAEEWVLHGPLFELATWHEARQNKAIIANPGKFWAYLSHRIYADQVQVDDIDGDVVYCTGLVLGRDNRFRSSDGIEFPGGDEECSYSGVTFARDGDKSVFGALAAMSTDGAARARQVYLLGGPLKAAFGFYPHCMETADKEGGKTTQAEETCARFGIKKVDGPVQFQTAYRRKKTLANTNMPVVADEVGRLTRSNLHHLVNALNSAYTTAPTTHGSHDKIYVLAAPLLMMGQDCPVRDEALLAKTLLYRLAPDSKNPNALKELRQSDARFPTGEWLEFAADYANTHDLRAMCDSKVNLLRTRLPEDVARQCAEADRTIANYATQLVAADVLASYGVDADIEAYVVARLTEHLVLLRETGQNVAEAFVGDLMMLLGAGDNRARAACNIEGGGVHVQVQNAYRALAARGYSYDVSDPRTITRLLRERGLAEPKPDRHYFNGVRLRSVFIRHDTLVRLGAEVAP